MGRNKKPDSWANTKPNIKCATIGKGKVKCYDIRPEINSRTSKPPKYSVNKIEERNKITEEKKKKIEKETAKVKKENPKAFVNPYTHKPKGMGQKSAIPKTQKLSQRITLKQDKSKKEKKKQEQTIVSNRKQRRLRSLKKQLENNKITKEKHDSEVERFTKEAKEDLEKIKKEFA